MNANKSLLLVGTQVDKVTRMFRAIKHPYRFEIVNKLLSQGRLTAAELSSFVGIDEPYILDQLDVLIQNNLVLIAMSEEGVYYEANEDLLARMSRGMSNLG